MTTAPTSNRCVLALPAESNRSRAIRDRTAGIRDGLAGIRDGTAGIRNRNTEDHP